VRVDPVNSLTNELEFRAIELNLLAERVEFARAYLIPVTDSSRWRGPAQRAATGAIQGVRESLAVAERALRAATASIRVAIATPVVPQSGVPMEDGAAGRAPDVWPK
jgi:hypothetical protein